LLPRNNVAQLARICLHSHGIRFDCDYFLYAADLHLEVNAIAIAHLQNDVLLLRNFEPCRFCFDVVVADVQVRYYILTGIVSLDRLDRVRFGISYGDLNSRQCGTGLICDGANDCGLLGHDGEGKTYQSIEQNQPTQAKLVCGRNNSVKTRRQEI